MSESKNLWGGRFKGEADQGFAEFNRSFGFDRRLFEMDVRASLRIVKDCSARALSHRQKPISLSRGFRPFSNAPRRIKTISTRCRPKTFTRLLKRGWSS